MPMKPKDRMAAAKAAFSNLSKTGAQKPDEQAQKMMAAGREEATQAAQVGASKTTMDEKTGKNVSPAMNKMTKKLKGYDAG